MHPLSRTTTLAPRGEGGIAAFEMVLAMGLLELLLLLLFVVEVLSRAYKSVRDEKAFAITDRVKLRYDVK